MYDLGWPASPVFYGCDPVQTTKTSAGGSISMLGSAKRAKARILLTSTCAVYGDPLEEVRRKPPMTDRRRDRACGS